MKTQLLFFVLLIFSVTATFSQPTLQWARNYDDPINGIDKATAITLDNNCNLFVTGQSDSVTTGADYLTIKYDYQGNIAWKARYNGPANGDDIPSAIKVDNSGNVYVTGKSQGVGTGWDYATVKYNSNGVLQWSQRFNNTNPGGNGDDVANDIALSSTGAIIYVTGYCHNYVTSTSNNNWVTIAYNAAGVQQWLQSYSFGMTPDEASKIKVSNAGNVYVLGTRDYYPFIIEYNAAGTYQHEANGCGGSFTNIPISVLVDGSNNIFDVNHGINSVGSDVINLTKSDQNGFNVWCSVLDGIPTDFKMDPVGNSFVCGYTTNSADVDMLVIKFDSNGDTVWTKTFSGSGVSGVDKAMTLAIDNTTSHNLIVSGYETNVSGNKDIVTRKLNNGTGATMWRVTYDQGCTDDDVPQATEIDSYNNIYVTGYSYCGGSLEDFATLKYGAIPLSISIADVNGDSLYCSTAATSFHWYKDGILLAGEILSGINLLPYGNGNYYCVAMQYCCSDTSNSILMQTVGITSMGENERISIFPNPSRNNFIIQTGWPSNDLEMQIINALGQFQYSEKLSGKNEYFIQPKLEAGMYLLQINDGKKIITKKLLIE